MRLTVQELIDMLRDAESPAWRNQMIDSKDHREVRIDGAYNLEQVVAILNRRTS